MVGKETSKSSRRAQNSLYLLQTLKRRERGEEEMRKMGVERRRKEERRKEKER